MIVIMLMKDDIMVIGWYTIKTVRLNFLKIRLPIYRSKKQGEMEKEGKAREKKRKRWPCNLNLQRH